MPLILPTHSVIKDYFLLKKTKNNQETDVCMIVRLVPHFIIQYSGTGTTVAAPLAHEYQCFLYWYGRLVHACMNRIE